MNEAELLHALRDAVDSSHVEKLAELLAHPLASKVLAEEPNDTISFVDCTSMFGNFTMLRMLIDAGASTKDLEVGHYLLKHHIWTAVLRGDLDELRRRIDAGDSVDQKPVNYLMNGWTPLWLAVALGREDAARMLIQAGADVNATDIYRYNLLISVLHDQDYIMATFLIESGANVNATDGRGCTPLSMAARGGNARTVKTLIQHGANINVVDKEGLTPLLVALKEGHLEVVKLLADAGANLNVVDGDGCTPLHLAVKKGLLDVAKLLVKAGANVNATDNEGKTPLFHATKEDQSELYKLLVEAGAKTDVVDKDGDTLLHMAARSGNLSLARELVKAGFNVNAANKNGYTVLHAAAGITLCTELIEFFIEAGADACASDKYGNTPLHGAAGGCGTDVARALIKAGADVNAVNNADETPIQCSTECEAYGMMPILIEAGASSNLMDSYGNLPLNLTCNRGLAEETRLLIAAGVDINSKDGSGMTSLHDTMRNNDMEIARILIEAGADLTLVDDNGMSAFGGFINVKNGNIHPLDVREMYNLFTDAGAAVDGATATISPLVPSDVIRAIVPEDTPFWLAANNDAPMLAAELAGGLDPNIKTVNGMTLLHWACAGDAPECVQLLLDAGADKEAGDPTPIFYCMHESSMCLECIMEAGAGVNQSYKFDYQIKYPFDMALIANSPACVTALVGAGAWVTMKEMGVDDSDCSLRAALGMEPVPVDALRVLLAAAGERVLSERIHGMPILYLAVQWTNADVVRVLVEGGADVNEKYVAKDKTHENVLKWAEHRISDPHYATDVPRLTAIVDYLKSLPCFSEEQ